MITCILLLIFAVSDTIHRLRSTDEEYYGDE